MKALQGKLLPFPEDDSQDKPGLKSMKAKKGATSSRSPAGRSPFKNASLLDFS